MAIQTRRGSYDDFDPAKMLPGELATVTSGDPGANDGRSVYACFAAGDIKRMATYEDMQENISQATQDIQEDFTAQLTQKISQADTAISQAQTAASAANIATQGANEARQEALDAAAAAESYVLGDISSKTVTFSEASTRENINTGESTSTLFGKIKKWFSDLGDAINQLNTNLGAIKTEYFTKNDSAIWVTPGTYIFMINYSISGTGEISISAYNFTDSEGIGFAINFDSPSNARGDIVRAITAEKSMQVGIHATGSTTSVLAQITAVRLK